MIVMALMVLIGGLNNVCDGLSNNDDGLNNDDDGLNNDDFFSCGCLNYFSWFK